MFVCHGWSGTSRTTLLTAVWALKDRKDVHGARLGDRLAKQPQQLLIPERSSSALRDEPGRVVQPELEPARAARPRAHLVAHREERDAATATAAARGVADVGARRGEEDVEGGVARGGDAQGGSGADYGWADVEAAAAGAGDPARVERDEAFDEG